MQAPSQVKKKERKKTKTGKERKRRRMERNDLVDLDSTYLTPIVKHKAHVLPLVNIGRTGWRGIQTGIQRGAPNSGTCMGLEEDRAQ